MSSSFSRRRLLQATGAVTVASVMGDYLVGSPAHAAVAPVRADIGVSAYPFDLGQVRLTASRWLDNQGSP